MTPWLLLGLLLAGDGLPYYQRPAEPEADLRLLRAQVRTQRLDEAFWLRRLLIYTDMGELLTIPQLVELLSTAFPRRPQFQEARMMFLSLKGEHGAAVGLGEKILREHPDYATIRANLARVYLKAGRRPEGVNLMLSALEQGPVRVGDWELLLDALGVGSRDPERVLAQLRSKSQQNPQVKSLKYGLVVACTRLGRYQEARRILVENPDLSDHDDLRAFIRDAGPQRPVGAPATP